MKHTIKLKIDDNCEIATLYLNENHILSGNFWDFTPNNNPELVKIYGYWNSGINGLIKVISEKLSKNGGSTTLIKEKFKYLNY